ncbi:MAG: FtsX-like permease family protein, partial [Bacteroidota bacterium]
MQSTFQQIAPNDPYERIFQERMFDIWYDNIDSNIKLMAFIGTVSIVLTCLGLYGLMSYRLHVRRKEFGIRKTMGAAKSHIVKLAFKEYRWILLIAIFIGATLTISPSGYGSPKVVFENCWIDNISANNFQKIQFKECKIKKLRCVNGESLYLTNRSTS